MWDKDSKEALFVRELGRKTPHTFEVYREFVETRPAEVIANKQRLSESGNVDRLHCQSGSEITATESHFETP
ncbi:MAG: hypothetical protein ABL921_07435 [Pirellula sp.]